MDNYETFKDEILYHLITKEYPQDMIADIESVISDVSSQYDITRKETSLIIYTGIPEHVKLFIASKAVEQKSKGTLSNYFLILSKFFQAVCKPVDQVTTDMLRAYLHNYQLNRGVKPSTLNNMRRCFHSFFRWCYDEEYISKDPSKRLLAFSEEKNKKLPVNALQLEYIRNECKTPREKAIVDFLFSTACRVSELCKMKMEDMDLEKRTVIIKQGKGRKTRTSYLNPEVIVSLQNYINSKKHPSEYLFSPLRGESDKPLCNKTIESAIHKIIERTGIKFDDKITPHSFRRTSATYAIHNGMPVEQVKEFLGHSNIATTMIYAKVDDFDVKQSHEKYIR